MGKGHPEITHGADTVIIILWIWGVPKMVDPQNGLFTMENPYKKHDLGIPPISGKPIQFVLGNISLKSAEIPWETAVVAKKNDQARVPSRRS